MPLYYFSFPHIRSKVSTTPGVLNERSRTVPICSKGPFLCFSYFVIDTTVFSMTTFCILLMVRIFTFGEMTIISLLLL